MFVSTVLFDDQTEVLHDRVSWRRSGPSRKRRYYVRGCTALLDAIGGAIHHIGNIHKYARPRMYRSTPFSSLPPTAWRTPAAATPPAGKGDDPASEGKVRLEFLFLGANIDAVETAGHLGIAPDRAVNYHCDSEGTNTRS